MSSTGILERAQLMVYYTRRYSDRGTKGIVPWRSAYQFEGYNWLWVLVCQNGHEEGAINLLIRRSFWSYELSKRWMTSTEESTTQAAAKILLCGGLAGVVTWASIFPLGVDEA